MGMVEGFLLAQEEAHARHGPNVRGLSDFYLGWLAGLTFRYEGRARPVRPRAVRGA